MKKSLFVIPMVLACLFLAGCCQPVVTGTFIGQDGVNYSGPVKKGDVFSAITAELVIKGVNRQAVTISPVESEAQMEKGFYEQISFWAASSLAIIALGIWLSPNPWELQIGPLGQDVVVNVGGRFSFTIEADRGGGEGEEEVTVPSLTGRNLSQAETILSQNGLSVGTVTTEASSTVPANIIIRWNPTGLVPVGTAINLVVSTGPSVVPMSVEIKSPANGQVFVIGQEVVVKVVAKGNPATGPYRLVVRNAELATRTIENVSLGVELSFNFTLTMIGSGAFTAYLEGGGGSVETYCSYSVRE